MANEKSSKSKGNSNEHREEEATTPSGVQQKFIIDRVFVKDSSFEAPFAPAVFGEKWEPKVHLDLNNQTNNLAPNIYEVVLGITVTVKLGEKTAFLAEVKQAGIFTISGFEEEPLKHVLGSFCPNILFPYIRERISSLIEHGGFPALYLAPINFDALYNERLKAQQQQQSAGGTGGTDTIQ
jgi:preprotein translocase subunit SecB